MLSSGISQQVSSRNAAPVPTNLMIQTSGHLGDSSSSALRNYQASQNSHTKSNRDNLNLNSRSQLNIQHKYPVSKMPRTPNNHSQTKNPTSDRKHQCRNEPSYTHKVSGSRKNDFNSTTPIGSLKQRNREHGLN
jgi:hypothetical protein